MKNYTDWFSLFEIRKDKLYPEGENRYSFHRITAVGIRGGNSAWDPYLLLALSARLEVPSTVDGNQPANAG